MDDRDRIKDRTVDVLTAAVLAAVALVVVAAIVAAGWRLVVWILP